MGAADPTDVFIPLLIATFLPPCSACSPPPWCRSCGCCDRVVLAYLGGMTALVAGLVVYFGCLDRAAMERQSSVLSNLIIFAVIVAFLAARGAQRVPLYETFVEGAKEGFQVAISIIPYLVAMLVAIGVLRASGALGRRARRRCAGASRYLGLDTRWVDGLPTGLMRTLSGSGARGMMIETMKTQGADSFAGRLVVDRSRARPRPPSTSSPSTSARSASATPATPSACGLAADLAGFVAAVLVTYWFFG